MNQPIKVWSYLDEYHEEQHEILGAVERVLESGQLILGDEVRAFEEEMSRSLGVAHSVGVANGTDALFIALQALDVGRGDEVITVTNTAVPTVSAIVTTGATPRFVDVESSRMLLDPTLLESAITEKTKAIIAVHLYGQCADMDSILDIASRHEIPVIEDCAQAQGATWRGRSAGSMGAIGAFSFYPTKILGTYGDGGLVSMNDRSLYDRCRRLRFYGMEKTYYALEHGHNSRLDEIHAAILRSKLPKVPHYIERRREIARRYDAGLADLPLSLPTRHPLSEHVYYLYAVRHERRDEIIEALKRDDIHLSISYPWPIHTMEGYAYLGGTEGMLPVSERAAREVFSLPMYPKLSTDDQDRVIEALQRFFR